MPLISIRGLRKYYRMGESIVHALDGVDLDIEKGEFVAITGASGSGKSTMMHLLGCLDRPTAGTFLLNGRNVSEMSDRELARVRNREIGFVFQTFNLINRTSALDNVGVPMFYARAANTRGPARRALERVGLAQRAEHTPSELSGGERQRVAIARAIVNDPLLVLADEPTGNLDTRTGEQIMEIFRDLNEQGVTIILVTHEQDVALQAKRIVQMRDGKIIVDKLTQDLVKEARIATSEASAPTLESHVASSTPSAHVARAVIPSVKQKDQGLKLDLSAAERSASPPARDPSKPLSIIPVAPPAGGKQPNEKLEIPVMNPEIPDYADLPPRAASGAGAVLFCGVLTPILLILAITISAYLRMNYADFEYTPNKPVPTDLAVGSFATVALLLLSVIAGIISVFWGRAVRRKIRETPGRWIGGKRALTGMIFGGATLFLLLASIAVAIGRAII